MDSDSLRKGAGVDAMIRSRDTSAQLAQNNGDAARLVYQLGLQMLLSGDPVKAARCFQEVSRVFCDWPLLWLRLAECCILTHQQQQEGQNEYQEQQEQEKHRQKQKQKQDDHQKQQHRSDNQKQQDFLGPSRMAVTLMSGGRTDDTWQYVLLPAGTRDDGSQHKIESGVLAESTSGGIPAVKLTALGGAGAGESTALSELADLMARRVRGDAGASVTHGNSGKQEAASAIPPRHHGGTAAGSSSSSSGGTTSDATLAWVELSLLNHLACLATAQHALSLLNTRNNPPPHAANDPRTQLTSQLTSQLASQKPLSPDRSSDPWQRSALRMYTAEALCLLGRPGDALSLLSECLVEFLEASPPAAAIGAGGGGAAGAAAAGAAAAGRGAKWMEWRESVYVNLAALHATKGDLAEARVCADKAGGGGAGGGGMAGGEEGPCAGGMAFVVQAYLELREALEAHGDEKADQCDRGVNAGRWEERCDTALRLLQRSNMVWFRMCNGNSMGA
ncbi:unnamed protein product [Closterium sp. NIES-64]|nr:unnamed protein product [Closterium sp. NIES-64]